MRCLREVKMDTLVTVESDRFFEECLPEKICLDGYCSKCGGGRQLTIAKTLLHEAYLISLELNGYALVPCPTCGLAFKIRPSTKQW